MLQPLDQDRQGELEKGCCEGGGVDVAFPELTACLGESNLTAIRAAPLVVVVQAVKHHEQLEIHPEVLQQHPEFRLRDVIVSQLGFGPRAHYLAMDKNQGGA